MVAGLCLGFLAAGLTGGEGSPAVDGSAHRPSKDDKSAEPTRLQVVALERTVLDAAQAWFRRNPPNGRNRAERRRRMAVIETVADRLPAEAFLEYKQLCETKPEKADALEEAGILYYLRITREAVLADIRATTVKKGLAVWHIYNMGYVFKSPDVCFGIDLVLRGAARLAEDLDFLLVTHSHDDHQCKELLDAMIAAGKPVVTREYPGSIIVEKPARLEFGPARVDVDIGDHHHPVSREDMLLFKVHCGPASQHAVVYHTGDNSNLKKVSAEGSVDLFIFHVKVGLPVARAIRRVNPGIALPSHLLELSHYKEGLAAWRWPPDLAYEETEGLPEEQCAVLTWGERLLLPGTEIVEGQGAHRQGLVPDE